VSPSADSANSVSARTIVPAEVLGDDEVVLLAVKPSGWFVLLASWPVLICAAVVAAVAGLAQGAVRMGLAAEGVYLLCLAVGLLRIVVASFQWLGRVYVLTDRRLMRIRGVIKVDVFQCLLRQVTQTSLSATRGERLFGLGSLLFAAEGADPGEAAWINLARPEEVRKTVDEAIRRARRGLRGGFGEE